MLPNGSEMNDTSTPFEQQLQVQCALDSVEVNTADKATDANGHPNKDSDNRIDTENMVVGEPQDFMIHDDSKTNDSNAEQTELMVDDDFEKNDASTTIEQDLQVEAVCDSVEVDKADKTTDAYGHASTDSDDRINVGNVANDEGRDSMIQDGLEMNDASMIIGQELQVDNVTHKQTNTVIEGGSKNIGEQIIVQGGSKDMEELLTMVDQTGINILCGFDNDRIEESSPEEVKNDDSSIGYESLSANCDSSDSSIKVSTKHVVETPTKVHNTF